MVHDLVRSHQVSRKFGSQGQFIPSTKHQLSTVTVTVDWVLDPTDSQESSANK